MSNIKELIRQEIDKRYAEYREKMKTDDFTYYKGMADALDLFEQFLDTLPDEPVTDCHDLEEEAVSYCFDNGLNLSPRVATDFARHFAEWQKRKMMEGAVDGVFSYTPYPTICLDDCNDYTFKDGDDALIIILPKED